MEVSDIQTQRAAAIQPQPANVDVITKNAREKAAIIPTEDLQREMIAQLYIQNHFLTIQSKKLKNIDTQTFVCAFFFVLSILGSIAAYLMPAH